MGFDTDAVFLFIPGNEGGQRAVSQIGEAMAGLAVKPMPVRGRIAVAVTARRVIALGAMGGTMENEGIGKAFFFEIVQCAVDGHLIHAYIHAGKYIRRRERFA